MFYLLTLFFIIPSFWLAIYFAAKPKHLKKQKRYNIRKPFLINKN